MRAVRKDGKMFLRNGWYTAVWSHELKDKPVAKTFLDDKIVLFRNAGGQIGALQDRCCHRAAPLGEISGEYLACGYHGWQFRGKCGPLAICHVASGRHRVSRRRLRQGRNRGAARRSQPGNFDLVESLDYARDRTLDPLHVLLRARPAGHPAGFVRRPRLVKRPVVRRREILRRPGDATRRPPRTGTRSGQAGPNRAVRRGMDHPRAEGTARS
jgi:nitrite reductase/ring-hydroxylating ferredoxin subunit